MNEQDILKDFKGSLIIDSEGKILSAAGTLQEEFYNSQGFATTILSMLHDVNVITTSNKQEFKRMTKNLTSLKIDFSLNQIEIPRALKLLPDLKFKSNKSNKSNKSVTTSVSGDTNLEAKKYKLIEYYMVQ
ncbi:hypothetical protein DICPUDRAFT_77337 [Dictyostelium purpureum]|uniref:Late endosomal/lysosomal adaptor and MAPK and MTOR activator 4 n=1 Tax=Dictyostelium purpureum TaxID=5786 RepID=F0ZGB4_DICPU|nr:uncharacterized protein DICPUDRAFT_77337 [Dictyostelium purpureum]EGC37033.1 hypothetical protein DICPUDRAFT_77337 [Dictyostelium purpureum]|eukprot:XP_003286461.1 hypothetical protein DICPUDRAFT_77337 [Dictyostelium purpureum]